MDGLGKDFLHKTGKAQIAKEIRSKLGLHKNKKNLCLKGCCRVKKISHEMGENICKLYIW